MNRRKPEQIAQLLHQVDEALGQGKKIEDICREHQISPATYYRWQQKYGGLSVQDAKRLKTLEVENAKLKRLVANLSLDVLMLKDVVSKKW